MNGSVESLEQAKQLALTFLREKQAPTTEDLENAVRIAVAGVQAIGDEVDPAKLRSELDYEIAVFQEEGDVLGDDEDHQPWLEAGRGEIDWRFWEGYREWIARRLPPNVLGNLDRMTDEILGRLEDPQREGAWDRRGMVVGQVQSGKTSNYTGLICKAADAGYKFIVVLAGMHNSLRSQTQYRLDEGFLGLDSRTSLAFTNSNRAIGVGTGGRKPPPALTLTSSEEKGDFARAVATRVAGRVGSDPVILVVKKNKTILENLISWVTSSNGIQDPETGRRIVMDIPLLVIDDEADNASVNTKKIEFETDDDDSVVGETDPTTINRLIRTLLSSFRKSALVSYTATPFANIFIDEDERSPAYGEDLFPRSFILRMKPPSNYFGPGELFGMSASADPEGLGQDPMPVLRTVEDNESWLEPGHKKDHQPGPLPASLKESIRAFILVCAAREARGETRVHNSMLVHVTRLVAVQALITEQIQDEVDKLKNLLVYGGGAKADLIADLRTQWESDFKKTRRKLPKEIRGESVAFSDLEPLLPIIAGRLKVLQINGTAGDALAYTDHPDGLTTIAVGGDKLSRGLTLEGLSVSYYLRASKMYDTLMQMGRWFGYKEGYGDLVRLYTTPELQHWYREVAGANEELGAKFEEMARVRSNPRDFALYVRKSPAGLLVTAASKMRFGREINISYSDDVSETISFRLDKSAQERNRNAAEAFLTAETEAGTEAEPRRSNPTWESVPGVRIAEFLSDFQTIDTATKAHARLISHYIEDRVTEEELTDWTVVLMNNTQATGEKRVAFAGKDVGLTERNKHSGMTPPDDVFAIRRLAGSTDESLDLDKAQWEEALQLTLGWFEEGESKAKNRPVDPTGPAVRALRPKEQGLLVLYPLDPRPAKLDLDTFPGFMVSFPISENAPTVKYVMPRRYWETG